MREIRTSLKTSNGEVPASVKSGGPRKLSRNGGTEEGTLPGCEANVYFNLGLQYRNS